MYQLSELLDWLVLSGSEQQSHQSHLLSLLQEIQFFPHLLGQRKLLHKNPCHIHPSSYLVASRLYYLDLLHLVLKYLPPQILLLQIQVYLRPRDRDSLHTHNIIEESIHYPIPILFQNLTQFLYQHKIPAFQDLHLL